MDPFLSTVFSARHFDDQASQKATDFVDEGRKSRPYRDWERNVRRMAAEDGSHVVVEAVSFTDMDKFGSKPPLFVKWDARVLIDGVAVPGIVFGRGGAVGILVVLRCGGREYTILTQQPRVPIGRAMFPEIPAGMIDSGTFSGAAAKELEEETQIRISADALVDMTELAYGPAWPGVFPSPGGCDEVIKLFLFEQTVTREQLEDFQNRLTGVPEEGERITLRVIELDDLWKVAPDAKALSALALYYNLKASNRL